MIRPPDWSAAQSRAILGALCSIATHHATTKTSDEERELIEGIRINILNHPEIEHDDEAVHIKPAEIAALITDPVHRARAAQLIAVMPYVTRPYSDTKNYISEKFIEALGENMHRLEDFLGARNKHIRNQEYCTLRKIVCDVRKPQEERAFYEKELKKLLCDAEGDEKELKRYQSLEAYPEGSLGRSFWDFYAQFDWPLPGDQLWISEDLTVRHDLVHVLCNFDISIDGEFQVSAFTAGNSESFDWMIAMLGFTPPYVSTGEQCRPEDFLAAYHRGANAKKSFVDNWDFWPLLARQVDDLRSEFGI